MLECPQDRAPSGTGSLFPVLPVRVVVYFIFVVEFGVVILHLVVVLVVIVIVVVVIDCFRARPEKWWSLRDWSRTRATNQVALVDVEFVDLDFGITFGTGGHSNSSHSSAHGFELKFLNLRDRGSIYAIDASLPIAVRLRIITRT